MIWPSSSCAFDFHLQSTVMITILTSLIPWFSKTKGNTYDTLLHHPFLFKEIQRRAQEVAATYGMGHYRIKPCNNFQNIVFIVLTTHLFNQ